MSQTKISRLIDSKRLEYINEPSDSDLDELWNICFDGVENQEHMNKYVAHEGPGKEDLIRFLTNRFFHQMVWLIRHKENQKIIGFQIHGNFSVKQRNCIGINIAKTYTKQGYAKEALSSLLDYFKMKDFRNINAYCFDKNVGFRKTIEACGMKLQSKTGINNASNEELHYQITF
ncbi:GNAT family N-acetyltransferase [Ancylomarina sp. YFZ004]